MALRPDRRASVTIDFDSIEGAADWFGRAEAAGLVPPGSALFQKDGLDDLVGDSGVPGANRLIVRGADSRSHGRITIGTATVVSTASG